MFSLAMALALLGQQQEVGALLVNDVVEGRAVAQRVASFDQSLKESGIPGKVVTCRLVVDVTEGRGDANHSYGGICAIMLGRSKRDYLICDDAIVGHFALASSFVEDRSWVVTFVKNNCTGG